MITFSGNGQMAENDLYKLKIICDNQNKQREERKNNLIKNFKEGNYQGILECNLMSYDIMEILTHHKGFKLYECFESLKLTKKMIDLEFKKINKLNKELNKNISFIKQENIKKKLYLDFFTYTCLSASLVDCYRRITKNYTQTESNEYIFLKNNSRFVALTNEFRSVLFHVIKTSSDVSFYKNFVSLEEKNKVILKTSNLAILDSKYKTLKILKSFQSYDCFDIVNNANEEINNIFDCFCKNFIGLNIKEYKEYQHLLKQIHLRNKKYSSALYNIFKQKPQS